MRRYSAKVIEWKGSDGWEGLRVGPGRSIIIEH
jgi:hypothetical protein